ncbi:MAG TPA: 3',5'-nucleoside bisphosphate phosphatase [Burkholderiales bacterium]|nr:3',5'-nucleoside bisphosphate phosphatase [Burkholderiales bacterium]
MLTIDLHCHSTRSDGLLTPAAVVARAAVRGVRTLALTDHDELGGLYEARQQASAAGLEFVNGVEISVTWNGRTVHIVGLQIDPENQELLHGLERIRTGRHRRAEEIASGLEAAGIPGTLAGAQTFVTNPELVGRTHFARHLVERGHARDVQSVFRKYLTPGKPGYVPHQWATLEESVRWISASGGMAVLAHPGRYGLVSAERESLLSSFVAAGGAGIEVVTGSHSSEQYATWAGYARRFGLLASAGSDFHGPEESRRDFGTLPDLPLGVEPVWERF